MTLTERSTNMLLMRKLNKGKNAKELAKTVIHLLAPFKGYVKSITTDNGIEFACHEMISKRLAHKCILQILTPRGRKMLSKT